MSGCTLCDLPTGDDPHTAPDVDGEFCCRGCLTVARSLDDVEDLDDLDQRRPDATPDEEFDGETTFLHVDGMHCATCESFLEMTAGEQDGVAAAEASYATDTIRVDYDPDAVSADELPDRLSVAGYSASDRADPADDDDDAVVRFLIGGGFFGMMAMLWYVVFLYPTYFGYDPIVDLGGVSGTYLFAQIWLFASIVLFYTGYPILRGAYVSLRARQPNMDLLVSLAATSSYAYSTLALLVGRTDLYFDVTIAVVLVVTAGNHYESIIKRRATGLLSDLTATGDRTVRTEAGETVAADAVDPGDRLLVRPGERVPFDGTVAEGTAAVDEALVTGESLPTTKREGDPVRGGTVVTDSPVVVEVGEDAANTLDTLVRLLWEIQSSRSGVQRLVDRLATAFVPLVVAVAAVGAGATLALGSAPIDAALVGLTVLIVSCPCALGLATPLAVAAGIRDAAKRGIVVVSDAVFESATEVDTVVLDKTGTLTDGEMRLLDATAAEGTPVERVRERAAAVERASIHPVAEAVVAGVLGDADERPATDGGRAADDAATDAGRAADDAATDAGRAADDAGREADDAATDGDRAADDAATDGGAAAAADATGDEAATDDVGALDGPSAADVDVFDRGVAGRVDGDEVVVGHPDCFDERGWPVSDRLCEAGATARDRGNVPVYVGWEGRVRGVLSVGDEVRDGWEGVVTDLDADGRRVVVLTGDAPAAAKRFADHPAIDEVFAEVPPEAKAETVRRLGADGSVAMVGDGSNDAPALAAADLGVSIASGTDLAADAADAVLLKDRLSAVPELFAVTRGTNRRLKQNLGWAFVYNAVAIPLALSGVLNPLLAALAMASSSILVVTNSARAVYKDD